MLAVRVFFSMVSKKTQDIPGGLTVGIERRCTKWRYLSNILYIGNQEIKYLSGLA